MKLTFNQWVFLKVNPKMFCKPMAGQTFMLVPFEQVANGRNPPWQYALVNRKAKLFKMTFSSKDEVIDALFKADEIWYGSEQYQNSLFNRKEVLQIEYDLANNES